MRSGRRRARACFHHRANRFLRLERQQCPARRAAIQRTAPARGKHHAQQLVAFDAGCAHRLVSLDDHDRHRIAAALGGFVQEGHCGGNEIVRAHEAPAQFGDAHSAAVQAALAGLLDQAFALQCLQHPMRGADRNGQRPAQLAHADRLGRFAELLDDAQADTEDVTFHVSGFSIAAGWDRCRKNVFL
jgi:hypothetical protein